MAEGVLTRYSVIHWWEDVFGMGLLPETYNCGLRMRRECRERFPHHGGLAIPARITARAEMHVGIGN